MTNAIEVPLVIRGEIFSGQSHFAGRRGNEGFVTADVRDHLTALPLAQPSQLADLYDLKFADILDYCERLGERLMLDRNDNLRRAFALSKQTSGLSDSILEAQYRSIPLFFARDAVREAAELSVGIDYLEGWVPQPSDPALPTRTTIRAFGARAVHIIAGNAPAIAINTIVRNAYTRSDAIIKTPSNDPLTATAVAMTMVEMDPTHPLSRHLTVAYWKGGDEEIESYLYDPRRIEKIIAWGGFASVKHVTRYLQPGIDLITLDPKQSGTIIGAEAFADDQALDDVATRLALDVGSLNQEACVNARVIYVASGTNEEGLRRAGELGERAFRAMQNLPSTISTPHKAIDVSLREDVDGLRFASNEYQLIGGRGNEGAVIVSLTDAPVDFASSLMGRVMNIVPVDDVETAVRSTTSYTQTVGVYPDSLKEELRDRLAFHGAQRVVSLGTAVPIVMRSGPHDGIEPVRRMCKWLTDETTDAAPLLQRARANLVEPAQ